MIYFCVQKLAVVMAEEDALKTELEEKQQEALASAIEEEESWLKALAQEQSSNIEIPTDTESEMGVSLGFIFFFVLCPGITQIFFFFFFFSVPQGPCHASDLQPCAGDEVDCLE